MGQYPKAGRKTEKRHSGTGESQLRGVFVANASDTSAANPLANRSIFLSVYDSESSAGVRGMCRDYISRAENAGGAEGVSVGKARFMQKRAKKRRKWGAFCIGLWYNT